MEIHGLQVSVIIPVFNGAATIRRAIESVLNQSFPNIEIIIVDDGSNDETVSIIEREFSSRVALLSSSVNRGAAAARNKGIAAAHSDFIAFLDSDDAWVPNKLSVQMDVLGSCGASIGACTSGFRLHKGGRIFTHSHSASPDKFKKDIMFGCSVSPGSTLLARREVFREVGVFDEGLRRLEDWDWLMRFSRSYELITIPNVLADIYLMPTDPHANGARTGSVRAALQSIKEKRSLYCDNWLQKLRLTSSIFVERGAISYRAGNILSAVFYVTAAVGIYPCRNSAFFATITRAAGLSLTAVLKWARRNLRSASSE